MILHRLARAMAEQNWFTVVLEVLIVVVGIVLGLQAANWNQDRLDRKAEIAYLERIRADLDASLGETTRVVEFQTRHIGYTTLVSRSVRACELPEPDRDDFASGIYLAGKYSTAAFVRASIQELLSAGRLTIIRNETLRQSLVETLQAHAEHLFYMSDVQLRTAPHVNYIDSVAPIIVDAPIGGGANVTWDRLDADFASLCNDRRFHAAVTTSLNYTWDSTASLMAWAERLSAVKAAVEAELVKFGEPAG